MAPHAALIIELDGDRYAVEVAPSPQRRRGEPGRGGHRLCREPVRRLVTPVPIGDIDAREVAVAAMGPAARQLRREVDDATAVPIFIGYHLAADWFDGVSTVIDDIEQAIQDAPLLLAEHAIERLEGSGIDDSDGWLSQAAACQAAAIAPLELAARLRSLAARSDLDSFWNAPETHREALGPVGLRALSDPRAGA
jgi:hypothetical protein